MEGWLQKRTAGLFRVRSRGRPHRLTASCHPLTLLEQIWKRRYFRLAGSVLTSSRDADGTPTCTVALSGASVSRSDSAAHAIIITLPTRATLCVSATTEAEAARWYAALVAAVARGASAAASPVEDASLPPLPDVLEIEGTPETSTELRLSCPEPGVLETLCIAWFRYGDVSSTPALNADVSSLPPTRFIAGANAQLYTCSADDVGKRLGVVVKAAGGRSTRWVLMPEPVAQLSATTPEVRARVEPHEHTKYCDRRVRVCTAAGRYREGATLRADVTGLSEGQAQRYGVVWYRSTALDPRLAQRRRERGAASAADMRPPAPAVPPTPPPTRSAAPPLTPVPPPATPTAGSDSLLQHAWNMITGSGGRSQTSQSLPDRSPAARAAASAAAAGSSQTRAVTHTGSVNDGVASVAALAGLTYSRVLPRNSAQLPPAPPDHAPATPLPILKGRLAELADATEEHAAAVSRPHELPPPRPLPLPGAPLGELEYALFREDVGRLVCCALVPLDSEMPIPACIQPHGPAPPQTLLTLRAPPGAAGAGQAPPPRIEVPSPDADVDESWGDAPESPVKRGFGPVTAGAGPSPAVRVAAAPQAEPALDVAAPVPVPPGMHVSVPVGPVEAAPPRAREVWIDGIPAVGCLLTGHVYYYGGVEVRRGACAHLRLLHLSLPPLLHLSLPPLLHLLLPPLLHLLLAPSLLSPGPSPPYVLGRVGSELGGHHGQR